LTYVAGVRETDDIDMDRWSALLFELMTARGYGSPEAMVEPQGPVAAHARTVRKWLKQESGAGIKQVRDVARALGYPPALALVRVGFLEPAEVGTAGLVAPPPGVPDPLVQQITANLHPTRHTEAERSMLRRYLQAGVDSWQAWLRTIRQAPPPERGARPTKTTATKARSPQTKA
jgi:hypothetical protein